MSGHRAGPGAGAARGFVLVGVVMMVMALTIIGISLYSLSGYESQFFGRTLFGRQALYTASGGIELAKSLLATPLGSPPEHRLTNVARAIGREGVVSAVAWQEEPLDSSGIVNWGKPVRIRVGVQVHGVTRTVEGRFLPSEPNNPYWRLLASASPVQYVGAHQATVRLRGGAWHPVSAAPDSAWIQSLEGASRVALTPTAPPTPSVGPYITAHYPAAGPDSAWVTRDYDVTTPYPHYQTVFVSMDAGPLASDYRFFRSASDSLAVAASNLALFDFYSGANVVARVRGTAVWVVPNGAFFEGEFRVRRLPNTNTANLVIVVGPNGRHATRPDIGAWFSKGIEIPDDDVNVFVVSSGSVRIEDNSITPQPIQAHRLSVYGNAIQLSGPAPATHRLDLQYAPSQKAVADGLYGRGLLPPVTGIQFGAFALDPGSWRQSPGLQ